MIIIVSGSSLGTSARLSVAPTSSIPRVNVPSYSAQADRAVSASYALSASWSPSSAGITEWGSVANKPEGIVTSSAQIDYTNIQNKPATIPTASYVETAQSALTAILAATASLALTAISSSAATFANTSSFADTARSGSHALVAVTSSFAHTASYFDGQMAFIRATATPVQQDGLLYHDGTEEALAFFNDTSSSIFLGKTVFRLGENNTGVTIPKGTVVEYAGTTGASGRLFIKPAIAKPLIAGERTNVLGIVYNDIAPGGIGDVVFIGPILGLNTAGFTAGDILYLSATTSGSFQAGIPASPLVERIKLGYLTRANATNGRITMRLQEDNRNTWDDVVNKPTGLVSSSVQIKTGSFFLDTGTVAKNIQEHVEFRPAIGTGTSSFDYASGSIFHLGGMTGNGVWNIVNVPTTPGLVSTFSFLISQGATPYSASSYHINSVPVTVRWPAGNPITGSANRVDMFGLTAIRSGSSWVVLGSSNTFA